jgi:hypothetical protein
MFVDLYEDDMLPPTITPTELIDHLARTYSQGRDNRRQRYRKRSAVAADS